MTTNVLVPGAWHRDWSWRPFAQRLRSAGSDAVTMTFPGMGDGDDLSGHRLAGAADHIVRIFEARDLTGAVLGGHSWGGYPINGAVARLIDRLAGIVIYSAHVPVAGRSVVEDNLPETAASFRNMIESSPTGSLTPRWRSSSTASCRTRPRKRSGWSPIS